MGLFLLRKAAPPPPPPPERKAEGDAHEPPRYPELRLPPRGGGREGRGRQSGSDHALHEEFLAEDEDQGTPLEKALAPGAIHPKIARMGWTAGGNIRPLTNAATTPGGLYRRGTQIQAPNGKPALISSRLPAASGGLPDYSAYDHEGQNHIIPHHAVVPLHAPAPAAPPAVPRPALPALAPGGRAAPAGSGFRFGDRYGTGTPGFGPAPAADDTMAQAVRINDHAFLPQQPGQTPGRDLVNVRHARVVAHLPEGRLRVRFTHDGGEREIGREDARNVRFYPGGAVPTAGFEKDYHAPYGRIYAHDGSLPWSRESALPMSGQSRRQDLLYHRADPVGRGMRFREVTNDPDKPFGPLREIVHIAPGGRHYTVINRESPDREMHEIAHDAMRRAIEQRDLRPEPRNTTDEYGDRAALAAHFGQPPPASPEQVAARTTAQAARRAEQARVQREAAAAHHERLRTAMTRFAGPDADEDTFRKPFDLRHGDLETDNIAVRPHEYGVDVSGLVRDRTGKRVGNFTRDFKIGHDGTKSVHHALMELDDEHQGGGFAQALNDQAEGHYRKMGVKHVGVYADITVGPYAWAKQGFDFQDRDQRRETVKGFADWAAAHGRPLPEADQQRLHAGHSWDLAEYDDGKPAIKSSAYVKGGKRRKDHGYTLGKAFLLSGDHEGWSGTKSLAPSSAHQQQWKRYKAGKGQAAPPKGPPADPNEITPYRPLPRGPSREGLDPATGHDAGIHSAHLAGGDLRKAMPGAPPVPRVPAPATKPDTEQAGQTFHFSPATGMVSHGTHAPLAGMLRPRIHDHVGIRAAGAPAGAPLQHGRVVGNVHGGVRVRYSQGGQEENLVGSQGHRGMVMAPGAFYDNELPHPLREPHTAQMGQTEGDLPVDFDPAARRREMQAGPQVGHRFREVHQDTSAEHPFGPEHEVAHVYPESGQILLKNREAGTLHELAPEDWHRAMQHHAFRIEDPNTGDEHGDHDQLRKQAEALRPQETTSQAGQDRADQQAAETLYNPPAARQAAGVVRGLTGGQHGLQKLIDTYTHHHGPLRSQVTHVSALPGGRLEVRGDIQHDETGQRVGDFSRSFQKDRKGNLVATHHLLELPAKYQGEGFAHGFNHQAERHYQDLGVDRSELHADITVGKYAWAQQGYDFEDGPERRRVWDRFKDWADNHGHTFPKRDYDRLRQSGAAWDLANYDPAGERVKTVAHNDLTGEKHVDGHYHLGKAFLLGDGSGEGWQGVKRLDPGSPHMRQSDAYRKSKGAPRPVIKGRGELLLKARDTPAIIHRRRHPQAGKEGASNRRGVRDLWYHGAWLLANDPEVAAGCRLEGQPLTDLAKALPPPPGDRQEVQHPGSRGGHWYYDDRGHVQYGVKPTPQAHRAAVGDHALLGGDHHRVARVDHDGGRLFLARTNDGTPRTVDEGDTNLPTEMAPAAHHDTELPPQLGAAYERAVQENPQADKLHRTKPSVRLPRARRVMMVGRPQAGDRFREWNGHGYSPLLTVTAAPEEGGDDIYTTDPKGQIHHFDRQAWRDTILAPTTRVEEPTYQLPEVPPPPPAPAEPDPRERRVAQLRQEMRFAGAFPGDRLILHGPFSLHGTSYPAGALDVVGVLNGTAELFDEDGQPLADLDHGAWQALLDRPEVEPIMRGEAPDDDDDEDQEEEEEPEEEEDPDMPGLAHLSQDELVAHVLGPEATVGQVLAAWTGEYAGYTTGALRLRAHDDESGFKVTGTIYDADDEECGQFERSIYLADDGAREVHHDLLLMGTFTGGTPAELTKSGFATAFNAQAEEHYRRLGCERVTTYADISVGKYVWARQGFDFIDQWERNTVFSFFQDYAEKHGIAVPAADMRRLMHGHAWDFAEYAAPSGETVTVRAYPDDSGGYTVDGTFALGRAFLLDDHLTWNQAWNGYKMLQDPDHPTQRQARKYQTEKGGRR